MCITQFFQRFISLMKLKFEIIELFFRWHIIPIENLINFKCTLKIRATSTEELGKLE